MGRLLGSIVASAMTYLILIIAPAWAVTGRLGWSRGWLVVGMLAASAMLGGLWFQKTDPDLVRERASLPRPQSVEDFLATALIGAVVVAWFVFASVDGARYRMLPSLEPAESLNVGLVVFAAGLWLIVWTMRVNSFASTVVKVQTERHHHVVERGPYALVRHPMYLGAIVFFTGIGLLLESTAAALAALPALVIALLPRIMIEEKTLRRDLAGYAEYQSHVRSRILPGIL